MRVEHVPGVGQAGIVELQHEAGVDDRAILDAQRLGDAFEERLRIGVMPVLAAAEHLQAADRDRGDEGLLYAGCVGGGL